MKLHIQWQRVKSEKDDMMTNQLSIQESMPNIAIQNARLAFVDLMPDMYAVFYQEPQFKGKNVRIYADEKLAGLDQIGSIQLLKKEKRDYQLVKVLGVDLLNDDNRFERMLPVGVYTYEEMGYAQSHASTAKLITTVDETHEIEHFQRMFQLKKKDAKAKAVLVQGNQKISVLGNAELDVDMSEGLEIQVKDTNTAILLTPEGRDRKPLTVLKSLVLKPMGLKMNVKNEYVSLPERILRDHVDIKLINRHDVLLLFLLIIVVVMIISIKIVTNSDSDHPKLTYSKL